MLTILLVMVPYFRRNNRMSLRPINRIKHVIDEQGGILLGVSQDLILADTTDTPTQASATSVETGSKINGIYIKLEANATTSAALANFYMMVFKNPGNNLSLPQPNLVGINDNKRFVIHQEMVMFQQQSGSNPRTIFNDVVAIPKGYRRNGPDDRTAIRILSPGVNANFCLQAHYKEFR